MLIKSLDRGLVQKLTDSELRVVLQRSAEEICRGCSEILSPVERIALVEELVDETLGFGPLERLLRDPSISDILINGPDNVFIEENGVLRESHVKFHSNEHLLTILQRIVGKVGRRVDESSPMVDARLPDGSRVNAIISPLAIDGALVSIRRFRPDAITAQELLQSDALTNEMLTFLAACVRAKANILITGGTGTGKTTFLNILSSFIPPNERIVTIEDTAELQLKQPHVARLEARPPSLEGTGEVNARDLLRNALRMRPDRIILGECRGAEAFDMLQAMNTGHSGSLGTLHANSTRDAVSRLEMLVGLTGFQLSEGQIARQIASAVQIIVQLARAEDGRRKVVQISEVADCVNGIIELTDIFSYDEHWDDSAKRFNGHFKRHNQPPKILNKVKAFCGDMPFATPPAQSI
ncbi:CpaF family protein [Aureliella helgolandensis]|uniref:CpaF family protein n=1 Tax=Aureliella helgolandensis TaxID=2527968 RepID=UPI001E3C0649|nr:CpaF family protein [Aureliella helgolandensis]